LSSKRSRTIELRGWGEIGGDEDEAESKSGVVLASSYLPIVLLTLNKIKVYKGFCMETEIETAANRESGFLRGSLGHR
jgi:hypothetical protein